jgi:hypothetical protein
MRKGFTLIDLVNKINKLWFKIFCYKKYCNSKKNIL